MVLQIICIFIIIIHDKIIQNYHLFSHLHKYYNSCTLIHNQFNLINLKPYYKVMSNMPYI